MWLCNKKDSKYKQGGLGKGNEGRGEGKMEGRKLRGNGGRKEGRKGGRKGRRKEVSK